MTTRMHASWSVVVAAAVLQAGLATAATVRSDFGGGDNLWETAANWNPDGVPTSADIAVINRTANGSTISVSSARTVTELTVSHKSNSGTFVAGTSVLNINAGAAVATTASAGFSIGRQTDGAAGTSTGQVFQTGGAVSISGSNGLRMSQRDSGTVGDSYYGISGGSLTGTDANTPLHLGGAALTFNSATFHVIGSGPSSISFGDILLTGSTSSSGAANVRFTLDNGGVTPIVVTDDIRFNSAGAKNLTIDLNGLPPMTNLTLFSADRMSTENGATSETFTGLPNLSPISASFGGYTYNWLLRYQDGSDDGVLDAFIRLDFVSRVAAVPEASSLACVGLTAGVAAGTCRLRRKRTTMDNVL